MSTMSLIISCLWIGIIAASYFLSVYVLKKFNLY